LILVGLDFTMFGLDFTIIVLLILAFISGAGAGALVATLHWNRYYAERLERVERMAGIRGERRLSNG